MRICPKCDSEKTIKNGSKEAAAPKKEIKKGRLTIECDEMWSFVGQKDNKVWI